MASTEPIMTKAEAERVTVAALLWAADERSDSWRQFKQRAYDGTLPNWARGLCDKVDALRGSPAFRSTLSHFQDEIREVINSVRDPGSYSPGEFCLYYAGKTLVEHYAQTIDEFAGSSPESDQADG